jgi:GxxExxY protein
MAFTASADLILEHRVHGGDTEFTEGVEGINRLTEQIIGAAIEVHSVLGPGLLESAYQRALAHEFQLRDLSFEEQQLCALSYKDLLIDDAYRLDFLVDRRVVVELKTVDALLPIHEAQTLSYLRFTGCRLGLLLNFRSPTLVRGLKRLAL